MGAVETPNMVQLRGEAISNVRYQEPTLSEALTPWDSEMREIVEANSGSSRIIIGHRLLLALILREVGDGEGLCVRYGLSSWV